jgi:peptide/nickel transport system permease protein
MLAFTFRRLLMAIPTLLFISLVIFLLLELAPGDPLTIPPEVRAKTRLALGLGEPMRVRYGLRLYNLFVTKPQHWIDASFSTHFAEGKQRIIRFQTRGPVFDTIAERMPQTSLAVGIGYLIGVLIGIISAYKRHS